MFSNQTTRQPITEAKLPPLREAEVRHEPASAAMIQVNDGLLGAATNPTCVRRLANEA